MDILGPRILHVYPVAGSAIRAKRLIKDASKTERSSALNFENLFLIIEHTAHSLF